MQPSDFTWAFSSILPFDAMSMKARHKINGSLRLLNSKAFRDYATMPDRFPWQTLDSASFKCISDSVCTVIHEWFTNQRNTTFSYLF